MAKKASDSAEKEEKWRSFAVRFPEDLWVLLNRAAFRRAQKHGGRSSMNAILQELVERHRRELEKELEG